MPRFETRKMTPFYPQERNLMHSTIVLMKNGIFLNVDVIPARMRYGLRYVRREAEHGIVPAELSNVRFVTNV